VSDSIKRVFDVLVACVGLVALSPLLVFLAVLVKSSSPGPVFYRGLRAGRYGRPFRIFKFRSMVRDGEQRGGTTTGKDDPRITRVGRFLRKYKLDELPQLFNLLLGDMSIVGPRPEVFEYANQYSPEQRRILSVRPGMTDLACIEFSDLQECVGADDPDRVYRERVLPRKNELRLKYVDERGLWLDFKILLTTVWIVLRKPVSTLASAIALRGGPVRFRKIYE
jgi:lipopolysaccharide/colanic/teichoic acid biosynthesis glycosyltransferase